MLRDNTLYLSSIGLSLMELLEKAKNIKMLNEDHIQSEQKVNNYSNVICFPFENGDDTIYVYSDENIGNIFYKDDE